MVDDIFTFEQVRVAMGLARDLVSLGRETKSKGLEAKYADTLNSSILDMRNAVLDVQDYALTSQQVQFKQAERIKELEQTVAEYEKWEAERSRYSLVSVGRSGGVSVYLLRQDAAHEEEPPHYICPRCYERRVKSILQRDGESRLRKSFCPECSFGFQIDYETGRTHGVFR